MLSLLASITAISLVAVLTVIGLRHASVTASEAAARARAATLANQGEQIVSAARLYYINSNSSSATLQELIDKGYLQAGAAPVSPTELSSLPLISSAILAAAPKNWTWDPDTQTLYFVRSVDNSVVCEQASQASTQDAGVADLLRFQCYGTPQNDVYLNRAKRDAAPPRMQPLT